MKRTKKKIKNKKGDDLKKTKKKEILMREAVQCYRRKQSIGRQIY